MNKLSCQHCNKQFDFNSRLTNHIPKCINNPDRIKRKTGNQYTKARELGLPPPIVKQAIWSDQRRVEHGKRSKEFNASYWMNEENIKAHSLLMKSIVSANPESYSKNNVSGRAKLYEVNDSYGLTKVKGKWELAVANWLNENSVNWTNNVVPHPYYWNNSWHLYFPDFFLVDFNITLEVKGYETERDIAKWASITNDFIVLREKEILDLNAVMLNITNKFA